MGWGVRCRCPRHQPPPAPPEVQTFFPGGRQSKHAPAQVAPALLFLAPPRGEGGSHLAAAERGAGGGRVLAGRPEVSAHTAHT